MKDAIFEIIVNILGFILACIIALPLLILKFGMWAIALYVVYRIGVYLFSGVTV